MSYSMEKPNILDVNILHFILQPNNVFLFIWKDLRWPKLFGWHVESIPVWQQLKLITLLREGEKTSFI